MRGPLALGGGIWIWKDYESVERGKGVGSASVAPCRFHPGASSWIGEPSLPLCICGATDEYARRQPGGVGCTTRSSRSDEVGVGVGARRHPGGVGSTTRSSENGDALRHGGEVST